MTSQMFQKRFDLTKKRIRIWTVASQLPHDLRATLYGRCNEVKKLERRSDVVCRLGFTYIGRPSKTDTIGAEITVRLIEVSTL